MKITNKKKFIVRTLEIGVTVATIILTILSINYANKLRGHIAYGGERLIPVIGALIIMIIEESYRNGKYRRMERH